jgi:hypothetical protein
VESRSNVALLSHRLGTGWLQIAAARRRTAVLRAKLDALTSLATDDAATIMYGSIGREQVTQSSDVDGTMLIDLSFERDPPADADDIRADRPNLPPRLASYALNSEVWREVRDASKDFRAFEALFLKNDFQRKELTLGFGVFQEA